MLCCPQLWVASLLAVYFGHSVLVCIYSIFPLHVLHKNSHSCNANVKIRYFTALLFYANVYLRFCPLSKHAVLVLVADEQAALQTVQEAALQETKLLAVVLCKL